MANRKPFSYPRFRAFDGKGKPLEGGTAEFFEAGTTTNRTVYSDPELNTATPNPITLNSRGEPESGGGTPIDIYFDSSAYKIVLKDSDGNTVWTIDNFIQDDLSDISEPKDPKDATDTGTDIFEGTLNRDPNSGEEFDLDFQSSNTTATPTFENTGGSLGALAIKTRDGSALWAGALEGIHTLKYNGTDYILLDPYFGQNLSTSGTPTFSTVDTGDGGKNIGGLGDDTAPINSDIFADTLSELQGKVTSRYSITDTLYLRGRVSIGDGGEGHFRWDSSDLSTEVGNDEVTAGEGDGGIYVAPDSDKTGASGAWVRQYSDGPFAEWYGTGTASFNVPISHFGLVRLSDDKIYVVDSIELNNKDDRIVGPNATIQNSSSGNPTFIIKKDSPTSAVSFMRIHVHRVQNDAGSGHIFDLRGRIDSCVFRIDHLFQKETGKKIFTNENEASTGDSACFFSRFLGEWWGIEDTHTVNAWRVVTNVNHFSNNVIDITRFDDSGDEPYFYFECDNASDYLYNNTIRGGVERTDGGFAVFKACQDWSIENVKFYDLSTTTNHLFELAASASGAICRGMKFWNVTRNGGTLGSGLKDIMLTDAVDTQLYGVGGITAGTGFTIDNNSENGTIFIGNRNVTVENYSDDQNILLDGTSGLVSPRIGTPLSGSIATIASGSITIRNSFVRIDTESFAASDDLATINVDSGVDIPDGFIVTLRTSASGRDVTLKDGLDNLRLAGDFTLSDVTEEITLQYDEGTGNFNEVSRSPNSKSLQSYSESNVTEDRTFDADSLTTEELADVVGTLIQDLRDRGIVG